MPYARGPTPYIVLAQGQHPSGQHGRMVYKLREHFRVDPAQLRKRFDFYVEKFPIYVEAGNN